MAKRMTNQEALNRIKEIDEENYYEEEFRKIMEKVEKQMANENKTQGE